MKRDMGADTALIVLTALSEGGVGVANGSKVVAQERLLTFGRLQLGLQRLRALLCRLLRLLLCTRPRTSVSVRM